MKKKIKSVKVLPPAFERNLVEDPEDMRKSMEKSKEESKIFKNEKQEVHKENQNTTAESQSSQR